MTDNHQTFWKNIGTGFRNAGSKIGESIATTPWKLATQALSGLIDQAFSRSNMRYQAGINKDLMLHQATLNQHAVDRQNSYNDPTSVSARARAAGVAPSLLLGGSPGSPGVSGASTGSSLGSVGSGGSRSSRDFFANAMNAQQLRNLESAADYNQAAAAEREAAAANHQADTDLKKQSLADVLWYNENVRDLDRRLKDAGVREAEANALIAELKQAYDAYMKSDGKDIANSPEYKAFQAKVENIKSLTDLNKSAKELNEEKKETEDSQQALNGALKKAAESDSSLKDANEKYQTLINEKFEKYGITPTSTTAGLALGLGTSIVNALGGSEATAEEAFEAAFQFLKDIHPLTGLWRESKKLDAWLSERFPQLSKDKRDEIVRVTTGSAEAGYHYRPIPRTLVRP